MVSRRTISERCVGIPSHVRFAFVMQRSACSTFDAPKQWGYLSHFVSISLLFWQRNLRPIHASFCVSRPMLMLQWCRLVVSQSLDLRVPVCGLVLVRVYVCELPAPMHANHLSKPTPVV